MARTRTASDETLAREHRALELRREGWSYQRIADEFRVSQPRACQIVKRARQRGVVELAKDVIADELARLDVMWVEALRQLRLDHVYVQSGKVVVSELDDGTVVPLVDEGAKLAALDRLLRIQERRAKLLGLDQPTKIRHQVITTDDLDAEIAELEAEVAKQTQGASPDS